MMLLDARLLPPRSSLSAFPIAAANSISDSKIRVFGSRVPLLGTMVPPFLVYGVLSRANAPIEIGDGD